MFDASTALLPQMNIFPDNTKVNAKSNNSNDASVTGNNGIGIPQEGVHEYMKDCEAHEVGIFLEKMVKVYSNWAQECDKDTIGLYNGPEILANFMTKHYSRQFVKILDIAAGTWRVGVELSKVGGLTLVTRSKVPSLIDALEPSRGMLDLLIKKNIYDKTYESAIGYKPIDEIRDDSYDSVVIAGGTGEGHVPVQAIDEFLLIVRQGGLVFIVMREEYLQTVEQYCDKLEPFMKSLVDKSKSLWILV